MKRFSRMLINVGRPRAELKKLHLGFNGVDINTTRADFKLFSTIQKGLAGAPVGADITAGTPIANRIGDKIFVEYIYFHLLVRKNLTPTEITVATPVDCWCRLRLLKWTGFADNNQFPTIFANNEGVAAIFARTNTQGSSVRRIVFDKLFCLTPPVSPVPVTAAGAQAAYAVLPGNLPHFRMIKKKVRVKREITFTANAALTGNTVQGPVDYSLHLLGDCDTTVSPIINGYIVVAFRDS